MHVIGCYTLHRLQIKLTLDDSPLKGSLSIAHGHFWGASVTVVQSNQRCGSSRVGSLHESGARCSAFPIHSPNAFKVQLIDAHPPPPLFPYPNENPDFAILEIPRRRLYPKTTTRHPLMRVARAPTSPMAVLVRCGLSLSHHPSHLADYHRYVHP
jgi:hypothetical protein